MLLHRDRRVAGPPQSSTLRGAPTPHGAKSRPPLRGRLWKSAQHHRSQLPDCASLLVGGLPEAITILVAIEYRPQAPRGTRQL
jgi:hypothetical protein